jgi:DNA-binding NtrC family response regulator
MSETKRILIIDDEPTALDLLQRILSAEGYEVVLATNGREGVERFQQYPCDLVVTDMVMPEKDGLQTILDLRLDAPDLPVVAISGGGAISKERYLAVAGYLERVETLAKPFAVQALIDVVKKLLELTDSESEEDS